MQSTSPSGLAAIQKRECLRYNVYKDSAGILTAGVGHKILPKDGVFSVGMVVDGATVMRWFNQDVQIAEDTVNEFVKTPLSQNEFDALVSVVFNTGRALFKNSDGTDTHVMNYLSVGNYSDAADALMQWVHVHVNGVAMIDKGLQNRREGEKEQFLGEIA